MSENNGRISEEAAGPADGSFSRKRRFRIGLLVAVSLGLLVLAALLRDVTTPIVVALVIAYVLDPVVLVLERVGIRRWMGVVLVFLCFLGIVGLVVVTVVPPVYGQVKKFPVYVEQAREKLGRPKPEVPQQPAAAGETEAEPAPETPASQEAPSGDILDTLKTAVRGNMDKIAVKTLAVFKTAVDHVVSSVGQIIGTLTQVVLVFIYTFFFLLGLHPFYQRVRQHLPGRYREEILRILGRLDRSYANFFRGRVIICLCSGIMTSVGLWICDIPFWLLIGMTVGVLGVIPFIGVMVGLIPAVLLALLTGGWQATIGVLIVFAVVQAIEPLLTPLILSKGVQLHPVTILIGLLVGGKLFGLFGAVISVPLASTAKILAGEFLLPPLRELAEEEPTGGHHGATEDG